MTVAWPILALFLVLAVVAGYVWGWSNRGGDKYR